MKVTRVGDGPAGPVGATGGTGPAGASVALYVTPLTSTVAQMMSTGDIVNGGDPIPRTTIGQVAITIQNVIAFATSSKTGEVFWSADGGTTALPVADIPANAFIYAGDDWATFAARASWGTVYDFLTLIYLA